MNNIASWIWVLIPLAAIGIAPFKMWICVKERQIEAQSGLAAEKSAQYAQHVERIEARLRVLEQIATDSGVQTAAQIEALRDQARIPIERKDPMNPFEFVLAILFMVVRLQHHRAPDGYPALAGNMRRARTAGRRFAFGKKSSELQERLKVLERITVEKENSLAKEIESLRDR